MQLLIETFGGVSAAVALSLQDAEDFVDAIVETEIRLNELAVSALEREKALISARGESTAEIEKQIIAKKLELVKDGSEKGLDLQNQVLVIEAKQQADADKAELDAEKKASDERLARLKEQHDKQMEENQKFADKQRAWFDEEIERDRSTAEQIEELRIEAIKDEGEREQEVLRTELEKRLSQIQDSDEGAYELRARLQQDFFEKTNALEKEQLKLEKERIAEKQKAEKDAIDASILARQKESDAKISIASGTATLLVNVGSFMAKSESKMEKFRKTATLIQIAQDTASAISSLMTASEANPLNSVTFGAAGVAQFLSGLVRISANVMQAKDLLSQKTPTVPTAPPVPVVPNSSAVANNIPQLRRQVQTTTTDIQTGQPGTKEEPVIKAYVVETEMRGVTNRLDRIEKRATL